MRQRYGSAREHNEEENKYNTVLCFLPTLVLFISQTYICGSKFDFSDSFTDSIVGLQGRLVSSSYQLSYRPVYNSMKLLFIRNILSLPKPNKRY